MQKALGAHRTRHRDRSASRGAETISIVWRGARQVADDREAESMPPARVVARHATELNELVNASAIRCGDADAIIDPVDAHRIRVGARRR